MFLKKVFKRGNINLHSIFISGLQLFVYFRNYNVYEVGDMVMYKSKHQKRPFEVKNTSWVKSCL